MKLQDFKLERYFARYEFTAPYLMCCSDCESLTIRELLALEPGSEDEFGKLWLGYTESQGHPGLRRAISSLYRTIQPEQVLVHAGAEEAIFGFVNSLLGPGDHVIVQTPCYQSLYEVARAAGCEVTGWELQPGDTGWHLDLAQLTVSLRDNTRAIIINSPHNPTGYLISRAELDFILDVARERNLLVFADEVYRYLEYDKENRLPWVCDLYENAVSLGVMSKSFGLPGLRIGWIATRNPEVYRAMAAFKDYTTICNSAPAEFLAEIALKNRERVLGRNRHIIRENLDLLDAFFARYSDLFAWYRPQAGPIAFPALKKADNSDAFCDDLVNRSGVLLLPGSCYDKAGPYFRVGFGRKNLRVCLDKLEDYLKKHAGC